MGNVKLSAHNFVAITLIAAVGLILINLGAAAFGNVPIAGSLFGWLSRNH